MKCQNQTSNLFQFKINLSLFMCVLFYSSFVCISAYANVYFKTTKNRTKHRNNTHCGNAFEPGASGLPYYCTSICVRSWCNWRASSVDFNPKKKLQMDSCWDVGRDPQATPRLFAATSLVSACPHAHPLGSVLTHIEVASLVSLIATPRRPRAPLFATLCCPVQQT